MSEFNSRVAIVTGASSGIGEATARRLADLGANVVVNSASSVDAGTAVAESLPGDASYVRADISVQDEAHGLIDATIERYGRLDYLVNNAGWTTVVPHGNLDDLTDEIFRKTFDVNVFGTWWLTKRAIPHLRKSDDPCIVNVTSIAGVRPVGSSIAYAMTKAALSGTRLHTLSPEQEKEVVSDTKLLLVAACALNHWTMADIREAIRCGRRRSSGGRISATWRSNSRSTIPRPTRRRGT